MAKKNQTNNVSVNEVTNAEAKAFIKQYKDLKKKHPDAVMLFRCGDFYELYDEDANKCAGLLGITLTPTGYGCNMAAIPCGDLDKSLPKIVGAGHKVAIVDPITKPKAPEAPVAEEPKKPELPAPEPEPAAEEPQPKKRGRKPSAKKQEPQYTFSTYQNDKGKTCAKINGFKEDDEIYQNGKAIHASKSWVVKDGRKELMLLFGPVYVAAAERLCSALNAKDAAAIKTACSCFDDALKAHRDKKAEARSEFKKKAERRAKRKKETAKAPKEKVYTETEVRKLLQNYAADEPSPELKQEIERLLNGKEA